LRQIVISALLTCAGLFVIFVGLSLYIWLTLPTMNTIADYSPKRATAIYSDDGYLVGQLYTERRTVVSFPSIPKHVVNAFLAAEDSGFYTHGGLDYPGILRALLKDLRPGAHLQGASTITQQTVKALVVGPERSVARKIREALLARRLEQLLSKDDILYIYLNQIYFGEGAYGVEEASRTYFGKSVRDLNLDEAAYLAAIPKNPGHYTLVADPAAAKSRQRYVLEQMKAAGSVDLAEAAKAIAAPTLVRAARAEFVGWAPHYVEQVRRKLVEMYGESTTYESGLTVYTGMSAPLQRVAHQVLRQGLEDLARRHGFGGAHLRIEVDRLARYRALLHEAFERRVGEPSHPGARLRIWDLAALNEKNLDDETALKEALHLATLDEGERTVGLVTRVDNADQEVWVDLGTLEGRIPLRTLAWARRFAPDAETPSPQHVSEVLRPGDLVLVEIEKIAVNPAKSRALPMVELALVPVPEAQGALVSIDPVTRLVKALVGGYEMHAEGFDRATQALRQPGSAFKPIVYAAGLQSHTITQASICPDTPILIRDQWTGHEWRPHNFEDGKYDGNITYRTALTHSKNTCSVKLIEKLTPEPVIALAQKMGIHSTLPANLTLALGSGDVKPIELANAITTIAAGGMFAEPILIRKIVDGHGAVLFETAATTEAVLAPEVAFVLTDMMRAVIQEGTGQRARVLERPLAGKTGTSNDARNVWFSGFSPELEATVWVGFDDDRPLGRETGASAALPIWVAFMGEALEHVPRSDFKPPPDVVFVSVDPATGEMSSGPGSISEAFVAGTEPREGAQARPSIYYQDDETLGGHP